MDPRTRLGLLALAGILAPTLSSPWSLGLLVVLCALPLVFMGVERRWWVRGAVSVAAVIWSTALSQGLFYSEQPRVALVSLGPLVLWREGVFWGLVQSLRFVALTVAGLAVATSTPPDRLHLALRQLRVPFGLSFLAVTALRFVPEVARSWQVVRRARARRGRPVWQRTPWAWLQLEVSLLRPVVATTLRRARALAETLDARGFDPIAARTPRRPLVMHPWEPALLVFAASITAAAVLARVLWVLYTEGLVYVPQLRGLYGFIRAWL